MVVEPVEPSELTGFGPTTVLVTARLVSMSVVGGGLGGSGVDPAVVGAGARQQRIPAHHLRRFRLRRRPFAIRHLGCRLGLEQLMCRRRRPAGHRPGVVDRRRRWAGRPCTQPVQLDALAVVYGHGVLGISVR